VIHVVTDKTLKSGSQESLFWGVGVGFGFGLGEKMSKNA
jgi:hypothetical protein